MSIVVAGIEDNQRLCIAADKRRMVKDGIFDDFQKLYQLKPNIFFGVTGIAEEGAKIFASFLDKEFPNIDALIEHIDSHFTPRTNQLTVTLAGKRNSGDYFLWNKNNSGQVTSHTPNPTQLVYSISSAGDPRTNVFFEQYYGNGNSLENTVEATIKYAASIDPSISETYDIYNI